LERDIIVWWPTSEVLGILVTVYNSSRPVYSQLLWDKQWKKSPFRMSIIACRLIFATIFEVNVTIFH
jgi:hypothetical protein